MSDFEKLINASDLIEWIIETDPDWCVGSVRSIIDHIDKVPSAEPPTRCIAEVKFDKQDLEELVNEKIEEIKEIKSEHEDFLNFLCNVINPNDMEEYLAMYNSKGEAEGWVI